MSLITGHSLNSSIFKKIIPNIVEKTAMNLFHLEDTQVNPIEQLGIDKKLTSKSWCGFHSYDNDIRGLHKKASRNLLKNMGMDPAGKNLRQIKAENFYRTTKTQFLYQLN